MNRGTFILIMTIFLGIIWLSSGLKVLSLEEEENPGKKEAFYRVINVISGLFTISFWFFFIVFTGKHCVLTSQTVLKEYRVLSKDEIGEYLFIGGSDAGVVYRGDDGNYVKRTLSEFHFDQKDLVVDLQKDVPYVYLMEDQYKWSFLTFKNEFYVLVFDEEKYPELIKTTE